MQSSRIIKFVLKKICKAFRFQSIEKVLNLLQKVLGSHGKVLEFHIKPIVATLVYPHNHVVRFIAFYYCSQSQYFILWTAIKISLTIIPFLYLGTTDPVTITELLVAFIRIMCTPLAEMNFDSKYLHIQCCQVKFVRFILFYLNQSELKMEIEKASIFCLQIRLSHVYSSYYKITHFRTSFVL